MMQDRDLARVLVVDDDPAVRAALCQTLELADLDPVPAGSFIEAKDHIAADFQGVILSDIRMPGRDGFHLLEHVRVIDAELPVILLTGEGDIPMAVRAMGEGAFGFLEKPCAAADLLAVVARARATRGLVLENRRLKAALEAGDAAARMLHGTSAQSDALRARVRMVAGAGAEVLVSGAPGAGISKVAEVVHLLSPRAKAGFVKRAAAGLSRDGLLETYQLAGAGSLFLDELGNLAVDVQFALLELLEQGGGARVIGGTNADLRERVAAGAFNADLFYRLDVMRVRIPSLAERPDDIPVLFRQYVAQAAEQAGLAAPEITPDVIAGLMQQDWPGNARALMSEAMRFVLGLGAVDGGEGNDLGLTEQMARVERSLLVAALRREGGHASAAAAQLKLPRKTFYDKLARYGIKPEEFR